MWKYNFRSREKIMKLHEINNLNQLLEHISFESMDGKVSIYVSEKNVTLEYSRYADGDRFKHEEHMRAMIGNITHLENLDFFHGCSFSGGGKTPLIQKYNTTF
jgi:hypothetical protein